jgi:cyclophilin family peptidyl-prolyl cis-trans isomerase
MTKFPTFVAVSLCAMLALVACNKQAGAQDQKKAPEAATQDAKPKAPESKPAADAAIDAIDAFIATAKIDKNSPSWKSTVGAPPKQTFDAKKTYTWVLDTSKGVIRVKLMPDVAPMHVTSTIYLTKLGFYDNLKFHRVIPGFMAQGGCPLGTGTGGPGYKYAGEFNPSVKHDRGGLLSMANAGPNTDGSQFFLTFVKTPWLDGKHTIFGEITEGMDVMKKLEEKGSRTGQTSETLMINKATIEVK